MLSNDKLVIGALNTTAAAGLYWVATQKFSIATVSPIGGMAVSTLFQIYHEDFSDQIKERCGDQTYKIIAWSYPTVVVLGGYLSGLTADVNLLVSGIFVAIQFLGTLFTVAYRDDRGSEEIERLSKEVTQAIDQNDLNHAETLTKQMQTILADRKRLCGFGIFESGIRPAQADHAKLKLVTEFLSQTPPNETKAEEWIDLIIAPSLKSEAFSKLCDSLSQQSDQQSKLKEVLAKYQELLGQLDENPRGIGNFLASKLRYANQYSDEKARQEVEDHVVSLEPAKQPFPVIVPLLKMAEELKESRIIGACLEKALRCLDSDSADKILSLVEIAVNAEKFDVAEQFTKHPLLTGSHRIRALIKLAEGYQKNHAMDTAKQTAQTAVNHAFEECPDQLLEAIKAQMKIDCEAAYHSAQRIAKDNDYILLLIANQALSSNPNLGEKIITELESRFSSLSPSSRLSLMKLQAQLSSERVFNQFQKHQQTWDQEAPDYHGLALVILARKHLDNGALELGKQRIQEIEDLLLKYPTLPRDESLSDPLMGDSFYHARKKTWDANCAEIGRTLIELRRQVKTLETKPIWSLFSS